MVLQPQPIIENRQVEPLKNACTTDNQSQKGKGHKGNVYATIADMCKAYDVVTCIGADEEEKQWKKP